MILGRSLRSTGCADGLFTLFALVNFDAKDLHTIHSILRSASTGRALIILVLRSSSMKDPPKPITIMCRLPAEFTNVENLWTVLASGESGWSHHPRKRLLPEYCYHPNPDKKGCYVTKGAHYLQEDLGRFGAAFVNVKAAEATGRCQACPI